MSENAIWSAPIESIRLTRVATARLSVPCYPLRAHRSPGPMDTAVHSRKLPLPQGHQWLLSYAQPLICEQSLHRT
jgi:hypothetical protein